jgi:uncharacterized protein (TIGR03435 family)
MKARYSVFTGLVIALVSGVLSGQETQAGFSFEVASIKPAAPFSFEKMISGQMHVVTIKGSEADFQFVSLIDLLTYAYRVKPYQIAGPAWIVDGRWDVRAKLPDGESPDRVPEMMLRLLMDRFKLTAHHESRESPAYELIVDNGGRKFKEAPQEEDNATPTKNSTETGNSSIFFLGGFPGGAGNMSFNNDGKGVITGGPNGVTRVSQNSNGGMRMEMSRMTMVSLANMLTPFLERPVIDGTGLKGAYQIALDLPYDSMTSVIQNLTGAGSVQGGFPGVPVGGFGGGFGNPAGLQGGGGLVPVGASNTTALMLRTVQQLGLKLQPRKTPVDTIVIDHLEKTPLEN